MKTCDLCGDIQIVYEDENNEVHFCYKHSKEMNVKPNIQPYLDYILELHRLEEIAIIRKLRKAERKRLEFLNKKFSI